ncbi:aromatase/cyclase [Streptomyces sp. NPDC001606]
MPQPALREVAHEITVSAPAATVHRLLAEVADWPLIYPRIVYAERRPRGGSAEQVLIWAADDDGTFEHWTSERTLDPERLRIDFRPTGIQPPLASMAGGFVVEPEAGAARLRLLHAFAVVGDDPEATRRIDAAVDRNSHKELGELRRNIERVEASAVLSFTESARIVAPAADVYDVVRAADRWPGRLPGLTEVHVTGGEHGLDTVESAHAGTERRARFHRLCLPHRTIALRQIAPPAPLTLRTDVWTFEEQGAGVTASVRHTVVLDPEAVTGAYGPHATLADAVEHIRAGVAAESRALLRYAKACTELRTAGAVRS